MRVRLTGTILKKLVDWHVECQTDGIVAVGTTGESPTLDFDEHNQVIAKIIEYAGGRVPVIAGTGANSTDEAIRLTQQACQDGADACLSVVPYYNKPTQHGLHDHFVKIADNSDVPVILYNVPTRTIADLADETLVELAKHPRISGIKDATGNIDRLKWQQKNISDNDFCYLSGDDATCCAYVKAGGHGVISVTSNIAPQNMHDMLVAASANDEDKADELDAKLQVFHKVQGVEANPIPTKWALADSGRIQPGIRLPLTPLSEQYHETVRQAYQGLN